MRKTRRTTVPSVDFGAPTGHWVEGRPHHAKPKDPKPPVLGEHGLFNHVDTLLTVPKVVN